MDVYASTPSGMASRVIDAIACSKGYNTMSADVSSAFLHALVPDDTVIYIQPPEDFVPKSNIPRMRCRWRLRRWLYGLRGSPAVWQQRFAQILVEELGFERRGTESNLFQHNTTDVSILIHVDERARLRT